MPWKVLEKYSKALKSPWILYFTGGFNSAFDDLNEYKIEVPSYAAPIKASQFYTNYLKAA